MPQIGMQGLREPVVRVGNIHAKSALATRWKVCCRWKESGCRNHSVPIRQPSIFLLMLFSEHAGLNSHHCRLALNQSSEVVIKRSR